MKHLAIVLLFLVPTLSFAQDKAEWVKTEGTITKITVHRGRKTRENAIVKFKLENGTTKFGNTELYRFPFLGSMKSVGDKITVSYKRSQPAILETFLGKFLSDYGMYILIALGVVFSIKPLLASRKNLKS